MAGALSAGHPRIRWSTKSSFVNGICLREQPALGLIPNVESVEGKLGLNLL